MEITWLNLFIYSLAVWRMSSLVANEAGPFHIMEKFRRRILKREVRSKFLHEFHLYEGITCEKCNSLWFGTLFLLTWALIGYPFVFVMTILAGSAIVIGIKYTSQLIQTQEQENKIALLIEQRRKAVAEKERLEKEIMGKLLKGFTREMKYKAQEKHKDTYDFLSDLHG